MAAQTAEIIQFKPKPKACQADNFIPSDDSILDSLLHLSGWHVDKKKHKPFLVMYYGKHQQALGKIGNRYVGVGEELL